MHLNTESLWNEEQIELSDAELQMVQGGKGATHKRTYGGNDCGGYSYNDCGGYSYSNGNDCGYYGGAYLNGYSDGSNCDGSQGGYIIMQVVPSSCYNSCYNTCG